MTAASVAIIEQNTVAAPEPELFLNGFRVHNLPGRNRWEVLNAQGHVVVPGILSETKAYIVLGLVGYKR
jgi:hypothetical protein